MLIFAYKKQRLYEEPRNKEKHLFQYSTWQHTMIKLYSVFFDIFI